MFQVCPICGGIMGGMARFTAFHDSELFAAEDEKLSGCLCMMSILDMQTIIMGFQERLKRSLKERFPGKRKIEVLEELKKMDRDAPLRVDILRRFALLDRARDIYKKRKKGEKTEEQLDKEFAEAHERGIQSEALPMNTWFKSFRPKRNQ